MTSFNTGTAVVNFIPILEHVPGDPFKVKKILSNLELVDGFINCQVDEHVKEHTEEQEEESTDFIHAYIREIRKHEASGNDNTTVNSSLVY